MIIETSGNQLFSVRDSADYDHAWVGIEVKKVKGKYVAKAKARTILVRKAATRIIDASAKVEG
jgi:hypothetical protein